MITIMSSTKRQRTKIESSSGVPLFLIEESSTRKEPSTEKSPLPLSLKKRLIREDSDAINIIVRLGGQVYKLNDVSWKAQKLAQDLWDHLGLGTPDQSMSFHAIMDTIASKWCQTTPKRLDEPIVGIIQDLYCEFYDEIFGPNPHVLLQEIDDILSLPNAPLIPYTTEVSLWKKMNLILEEADITVTSPHFHDTIKMLMNVLPSYVGHHLVTLIADLKASFLRKYDRTGLTPLELFQIVKTIHQGLKKQILHFRDNFVLLETIKPFVLENKSIFANFSSIPKRFKEVLDCLYYHWKQQLPRQCQESTLVILELRYECRFRYKWFETRSRSVILTVDVINQIDQGVNHTSSCDPHPFTDRFGLEMNVRNHIRFLFNWSKERASEPWKCFYSASLNDAFLGTKEMINILNRHWKNEFPEAWVANVSDSVAALKVLFSENGYIHWFATFIFSSDTEDDLSSHSDTEDDLSSSSSSPSLFNTDTEDEEDNPNTWDRSLEVELALQSLADIIAKLQEPKFFDLPPEIERILIAATEDLAEWTHVSKERKNVTTFYDLLMQINSVISQMDHSLLDSISIANFIAFQSKVASTFNSLFPSAFLL
mgnify:FL=1